jgi:hypothetical protein
MKLTHDQQRYVQIYSTDFRTNCTINVKSVDRYSFIPVSNSIDFSAPTLKKLANSQQIVAEHLV